MTGYIRFLFPTCLNSFTTRLQQYKRKQIIPRTHVTATRTKAIPITDIKNKYKIKMMIQNNTPSPTRSKVPRFDRSDRVTVNNGNSIMMIMIIIIII